MKRRRLLLATVTLCSANIYACGSSTAGTSDEGAHVRATATAAATYRRSEATQSSRSKTHRHRSVLTPCDSNIKVDATTTTCEFAENVFYEYWRATQSDDGSSIDAYSPTARRS
jgi:phytoene/squalene synthetase